MCFNQKKPMVPQPIKEKKIDEALKEYINALLAIIYDKIPEHTKEMNTKLKLDLINNVVACLLELECNAECIIVSNIALNLYPSNAKLLTRRGKVYLRVKDYENARKDLLQAKENCTDEKSLSNIEELLRQIPKIEKPKTDLPFGKLYDEKPQFADPEKNAEEEEKQLLPKLSNIQWLFYPYKKMFKRIWEKICCKKSKGKINQLHFILSLIHI
eukprot:TRINITY_DN3834_c0_g1_i1.p1 TRINITY_DN3834_c0_g1~~TRINITY_DN3834_c0_g1_i1.p1  ORF type:complete len:214 (-),score=57.19 TRINITY_DN3834_c0_g1_i1:42-683(-)